MTEKRKLLFINFLLVGLLCLEAVVVSKHPGLGRKFIRADMRRYGELYDMCKIATFKIVNPPVEVPQVPNHPANECEVIFAGDSFFGNHVGKIFEKNTGIHVYNIWLKDWKHPVDALREIKYAPNPKTRHIVVELSELPIQQGYFDVFFSRDPSPPRILFWEMNEKIKNYLVDRQSLEYLLSENPIVAKLLELRNTFRFLVFRDISSKTPVYSLNPPMLHFFRSIDGNRLHKSEEKIELLADRIAALGAELERTYGLKMIFMPIPNKYSIYGYDYGKYRYNSNGEKYDDFLPRLKTKLDRRGVMSVDLYAEFRDSKEPIFEPSDNHWNTHGVTLGLKKLLEVYNRSNGSG